VKKYAAHQLHCVSKIGTLSFNARDRDESEIETFQAFPETEAKPRRSKMHLELTPSCDRDVETESISAWWFVIIITPLELILNDI